MLSVIVPSYNEESTAPAAADAIAAVLRKAEIPYELLFVDDGSTDGTWKSVEKASEADPSVRGVRFSRNFGKEAAIMAGLTEAKGDCCVVIDCDLQHPPEKIVEMYRLWEEGYQVVEGVKTSRAAKDGKTREPALRGLVANGFYALIGAAVGFDMRNTSDFKLLDRKAVDVLVGMRERNSFFRALSFWIGFKTTRVLYEVRERTAGESKWSPLKLTKYALRNIASFSTAPMQFVTLLGLLMLAASVALGAVAIVQKLSGSALEGFTTVIIIQLFSSSVVMTSIGIVGYYIARIFEEVKKRPLYIVSEKLR